MHKEPASDVQKHGDSTIAPRITDLGFGTITVNGTVYVKDIVIEGGGQKAEERPLQAIPCPVWAHSVDPR